MIRQVELQDAKAITNIYNEYVLHSVATFDTEPVQEEEMRARIAEISSRFPYFVYEEDKEITGSPPHRAFCPDNRRLSFPARSAKSASTRANPPGKCRQA